MNWALVFDRRFRKRSSKLLSAALATQRELQKQQKEQHSAPCIEGTQRDVPERGAAETASDY
jgi:hypothetical protein